MRRKLRYQQRPQRLLCYHFYLVYTLSLQGKPALLLCLQKNHKLMCVLHLIDSCIQAVSNCKVMAQFLSAVYLLPWWKLKLTTSKRFLIHPVVDLHFSGHILNYHGTNSTCFEFPCTTFSWCPILFCWYCFVLVESPLLFLLDIYSQFPCSYMHFV